MIKGKTKLCGLFTCSTSPSRTRHEPLSTEGARTLTSRRDARGEQRVTERARLRDCAHHTETSSLNNGSIQQLIYRWRHAGADEWSSAEILRSVPAVIRDGAIEERESAGCSPSLTGGASTCSLTGGPGCAKTCTSASDKGNYFNI